MATPEENLIRFQEIANRGLQARLPPELLVRFNTALDRGLITLPEDDQEMNTFQFFERTLGQQLIGTGEMLTTILSGALTEPVAGLAGITEGVAALIAGDDDPLLRAAERVERVRLAGTRTPRTKAGQESLQAIAAPIEALFSGIVQPAAEFVGDVTGSPLAATLVQTAAETFPPGLRPRPGALARRAEGAKIVEGIVESTGVPLQLPIFEQAQLIGGRAEALVQGQTFRAENFAQVQQSLIKAKDIAKANTDKLFSIAKETKATIPRDFITILNDSIKEAIADVSITDFRGKVMANRVNLNNRLLELDELVMSEIAPASVQLNELSAFRRRLNTNKGLDATERFALGEIKGVLDGFLSDMFDADMISGDPAAIQRWTDANTAFADFKKTFSDDKTIKKLTEQLTDPEQVKNWILGTSAVGGKVEAGKVVDSIGDIIGKDSPQFDAIRQEVLFDILEPIMKPEVNAADLQKYIVNYDKFVRNRMSLSKSIYPESIDALRDLRDLASSATNVSTPAFKFKFASTAARGLWGNALARSAVRIGLLTQVFELMKSAGTTRSRQISARILGYNLRAPVLPIRPLLGIGALQTLGEPAELEQQMLDRQIRAIP